MASDRLLRVGIIGIVVTMLCCFAPALLVLTGAVGVAALLGWLDYLLVPAFAGFLALTGYALWKRHQRSSCAPPSPAPNAATPRPR